MPVATDDCDADVSISETQETLQGPCPDSYVVVRTFTATDNCGNTARATQRVNVLDGIEPSFVSVPASRTVACDEDPGDEEPVATDDCDASVAITMTETTSGDNCASGIQLVRIWTATDNCGNTATASQTITFTDTEAPVFAAIDRSQTIECDQPVPLIYPTATDNCDQEVEILYFDNREDQPCGATISRTWVASDECGNTVSAVQLIIVTDSQPPVLRGVPSNAQVNCDELLPTADVTATDNCATDLEVRLEEFDTPGECPGERAVTRVWSAQDDCGNVTTASQVVTVTDGGVPTFSNVPANVTISCDDEIPADLPTASDNCSGGSSLSVSVDTRTEPGSCGGNYRLIRTFSATDECGNLATASQVVVIRDAVAPVFASVPQNETITCGSPIPTSTATATDNCDVDVAIAVSERIIAGACDDSYEVLRVWTATDACGNATTASQTITVEDTTAPTFAGVPDDLALGCNDNAPVVTPTASDDCDDAVEISLEETRVAGTNANEYTLVRTWTALDNCGNTATASQQIVVTASGDPRFTFVPADLSLNCGEPVPNAEARAVDDCDGDLVATLDEERENGSCANQYTLVRTWTATNQEGTVVTATQRITVSDATAPQFVEVPADLTLACGDDLPSSTALATDDCDNDVEVSVQDEQTQGSCASDYVVTRIFTATDDCGNASTATQRIFFQDDVAPVFDYVPASEEYACALGEPTDRPRASDNCSDEVTITYADLSPSADCSQRLQRVWTATDDCGNTVTAVQQILLEDNEDPVLTNVPDNTSIDLSSGGTVPAPAQVGATDNCSSNLQVELDEQQVAGNGCDYILVRTWTATDQCGNSDQATQRIAVTGNDDLVVSATVNNRTCSGKGSIFLNLPNGGAGYLVDWADLPGSDDPADRPELLQGTYVVSVARGGCRNTYTYEVIDECDWTGCTFVEQDQLLIVEPDCGASNGSIGYPADTTGYDWAWTPAVSNGNTASNLAAGSYQLTITKRSDPSCTRTYTVVLTSSSGEPITASTNITNVTCERLGSVEILPGTQDTYSVQWADESSPRTVLTREELTAGSYSFTLVNAAGCSLTQNLTVADNCACAAENSIVRAEETDVCLANNSAEIAIVAVTPPVIPVDYGCSYLLADVASGNVMRTNKSGRFTVAGSATYSIHQLIYDSLALNPTQFGPGATVQQVESMLVQGGGAICGALTTYGARITTAQCCITPEISSVTTTDGVCGAENGVANVQVLGDVRDYLYEWTPDLGAPLNQTGNIRGSLPVGVYTVRITNRANADCFAETTLSVGAADIDAGLPNITAANCGAADGQVDFVGADPDLSFVWSDGGAGPSRTDLAAGTYTVTVTHGDNGACVETIIVDVPSSVDFGLTAVINTVPTCGEADGQATIRAQGGSGNFEYSWGTGPMRNDLRGGTYTVLVTDRITGCTDSITFTLEEQVAGGVRINIEDVALLCNGVRNGTPVYTLDYDADFRYPPQISFVDSDGEPVIFGELGVGEYCMIIRDADDCIAGSGCFSVSEPPAIQVSVTATAAGCDDDGTITLDITGGTPPYRFDWAHLPAASDPRDLTGLNQGQYTVFITDANGCAATVNNIAIGRNCGCAPTLPSLQGFDAAVCLLDDEVLVGTRVTSSTPQPGIETSYLLASQAGTVLQVSDTPEFWIQATGNYTIHALVYDPLSFNLAAITIGSSTVASLNAQFVQGGGFICAGLDLAGTPVTVNDCPTCSVSLGTLTTNSSTVWCTDDGLTSPVEVDLSASAGVVTYLVVDASGAVVLAQADNTLELEGLAGGAYSIYALATEAAADAPSVGDALLPVSGCAELSQAIPVTALTGSDCTAGCQVNAGVITSVVPATVCLDDLPTQVVVDVTGSTGSQRAYVVTDMDGRIVAVETLTGTLTVDVSMTGQLRVYALAYEQPITGLEVGRELRNLAGCFDLSQPSVLTVGVGAGCGQTPQTDTVRFALEVTTADTVCFVLDPGFDPVTTTYELVGFAGTQGQSGFGEFTLLPNGCVIYEAGSVPGIDVDEFQVIARNGSLIDTTVFIVSITTQAPSVELVTLSVGTLQQGTACPAAVPPNYQTPIATLASGGQVGSSLYGSFNVDANTGCLTYTAGSLTGSFVDTVVVLVCDASIPACHTVTYVISVLPQGDQITRTVQQGDTLLLCAPTGLLSGTPQQPTLCGGPNEGSIVFDPATSCFVYTAPSDYVGPDAVCIEVCDDLGVCVQRQVNITVIDACGDLVSDAAVAINTDDCDGFGSYCLPIAQASIDEYALILDGVPYRNTNMACDAGNGTQVFADTGRHVLVIEELQTGCRDTVQLLVGCQDCGLSTTPALIEVDDCDDTAEITLSLLQGNWDLYSFTLNGTDVRDELRAVGAQTRLTVDTGLQTLIVQALDNSCQEEVVVDVRCEDSPGGTGASITRTITVSFSDTICISELGLGLAGDVVSVTDVCPGTVDGGEAAIEFDASTQCFSYTGLLPGTDSLCLAICTATACDTLGLTVNVLPLTPSSDDILVPLGTTGIYCLDTTELASPITEVFNFCPDDSGDNISVTLDQDTYCVQYEGIALGMERACFVICNAIACDTVFLNFNVTATANDLPPVAVDDRDETTKGMSVDINILRNDTLNGPLIQISPISLPANGNLFVVNDSIIRYTPNENFCGGVDSFQYVISNGVAFDTATVRIEVACDELVIFSGFSPNGDGVNDLFRILGIEAYPGNKVLIFNRWGNEVYSRENYSNQPGEAFDGRWDGNTLPDGTYFYVIDLGGTEGCRSGYLQIVR